MKKFTKSDLRDGDVVEYRRGDLRTIKGDGLCDCFGRCNAIGTYRENLKYPGNGDLDIVEVYRSIWKREEPTITSIERVLLENVEKKYKYIARDHDSELYLFGGKPTKETLEWDTKKDSHFADFSIYSHLFSMVKWEDEEPWLIEDLLNLPEKEGETK